MKKAILLSLLVLAGCQKTDVTPKGKLPDPHIADIVWFDYWNMDKIEMRYFDIADSIGKIKGSYPTIDVIIVGDDGTETNLNEGGGYWWNMGKLYFHRFDDGIFDNTNYDDTTVINRVYVIIY
jgi:hypothetical protein